MFFDLLFAILALLVGGFFFWAKRYTLMWVTFLTLCVYHAGIYGSLVTMAEAAKDNPKVNQGDVAAVMGWGLGPHIIWILLALFCFVMIARREWNPNKNKVNSQPYDDSVGL